VSTFLLPEAVHVSFGSKDLDFPAGTVVASTVDEERALNLVESLFEHVQKTLDAPIAPVAEPAPAPASVPLSSDPVVESSLPASPDTSQAPEVN